MQGRRDNNEDRAAIENVEMVAGAGTGETVQLWAVMDGHGGQVTCSDMRPLFDDVRTSLTCLLLCQVFSKNN